MNAAEKAVITLFPKAGLAVPEAVAGNRKIEGWVLSGAGRGAQFLSLEWVQKQLREKLDMVPFPGTLNLQVSPETRNALFARREGFLKIAEPSAPDRPASDCPGYIQRVTLLRGERSYRSACLILPELTMHKDVLEIIAADNLRDALNLKDGDRVQVEEFP